MDIVNVEQLLSDLKELYGEMLEKSKAARKERSSIERDTFEHGFVMGEEYTYEDSAIELKFIIDKYTGE